MSEVEQQQTEQQVPVLSFQLTVEQYYFIQNSLGKLPTETGAWIVRQILGAQAQPQLDALQPTETAEPSEESAE